MKPTAKAEIETMDPRSLVPYARNARQHSAAHVAQIAGSIREFGFNAPVLIDADNGIIAGHGRVQAALSLGLDGVPCVRLAHLTDSQRRAYILADNKIALNSTWDDAMLALEAADLKALDVDLGLVGFSEEEIDALTNAEQVESAEDKSDLVITDRFDILIQCGSEERQVELIEFLEQNEIECKPLM